MTTPDPDPEFVPFAGMLIPGQVRDQLVEVLRRRYATVTATLDDDAAVQAVLVDWMLSLLEADAAEQANKYMAEATATIAAQHAALMAQGRAMAQQAVAAITKAAGPPNPPHRRPTEPAPGGAP